MKFLQVKNWEKHQHYKDRTPPWIKLSRDLLNHYEFTCLQDASKLHLILIWLLASQMDNKIPADSEFIKKRINVSSDINFKELIDNGFLIDASGMLSQCKQVAMVETETEEETEEEKESVCVAKAPPKKLGTRFDMKKHVDDSWLVEAQRIKPELTTNQVKEKLEGFSDHWIAKTGKDATKMLWIAVWRNWIRNDYGNKSSNPKQPNRIDEMKKFMEEGF